MKVSYKKLWVMCVERDMSKGELRKKAGVSSATFTKLRRNQEVSLSVLMKIAEVMDCNIGDMMDFVKDDEYTLPEVRGLSPDSRGSRQMEMQTSPVGLLLAEIEADEVW